MSKGRGYLLPAGDAFTDQMTCVRVYVPNRVEYLRALIGSLDYLAGWNAWERDELHRGIQAAASWRIANELTNDTIDKGCPPELPPVIIIDDDGNIHLDLRCDEMCTINIYCGDGTINGGGGDDDNGGGTVGPPITPPPVPDEGYVLIPPLRDSFGFFSEAGVRDSDIAVSDAGDPNAWWLTGTKTTGTVNTFNRILWDKPLYPGTLYGVIFTVNKITADDATTEGIEALSFLDIEKVNNPQSIGIYVSGAPTAVSDWFQALVTDHGYDSVASVYQTTNSKIGFRYNHMEAGTTIDELFSNVYFLYSNPFG